MDISKIINSNAPWLEIAKKEIGVKEIAGKENNPRIIEYAQTTTLKAQDDETSWCSSFVNWCMKQAKIKGTGSAAARSWLTWGKSISTPQIGCVVVFWRNDPKSSSGHVAFYVGETSSSILVLGGNQNNQVCVASYPKTRFLDYRWLA